MKWFKENVVSVLLNIFVGILMLYFTHTFNKRAEKIDSKADKEYVDMKNEAQDEKIEHNREILELNLKYTKEDRETMKKDIKEIKEMLKDERDRKR